MNSAGMHLHLHAITVNIYPHSSQLCYSYNELGMYIDVNVQIKKRPKINSHN